MNDILILVAAIVYLIVFIINVFEMDRTERKQSKRKTDLDILIELMGKHLNLLMQELKVLESKKINKEKLKNIRIMEEKIRESILMKLA